jgi:Arm DNA-binding domain
MVCGVQTFADVRMLFANIPPFCWHICWYLIEAEARYQHGAHGYEVLNAKGQIKPRKLSDGGGLHLLINPDGAKYWRLAYRWNGKQRTLAIGVYPAIGLMEARAARDEAKRNLAADIDPSVVKQERKRAAKIATANTFEAVAREWHEKVTIPRQSRGL